MTFEVEIKARVQDYTALKTRLEERYGAGKAQYKSDQYFSRYDEPDDPAFRFRIEQSEDGEKNHVTAKIKTIEEGVEVNTEVEFSVSDPKAFSAFSAMLDYTLTIEKTKNGYAWTPAPATTIELTEVGSLGYFLEIEELVESWDAIKDARARILDILTSLGFSEKDIEPRFYIDMLQELRRE